MYNIKFFRIVSVVTCILGGVLLCEWSDAEFEILPFPGEGFTVETNVKLHTGDSFDLMVYMPALENPPIDDVPVELLIVIDNGISTVKKTVSLITPFSEDHLRKMQYYHSKESWSLNRGQYNIVIKCMKNSPAVTMRGATVAIEYSLSHVTERFVLQALVTWSGRVLLFGGLLGFLISTRRLKPAGI